MALPENHHKALFALTKEALPAISATVKGRWTTGFAVDPLELLAHRRMEWTMIWNKDPDVIVPSLDAMLELRQVALTEQLPAITLEQLDNALWTFKDKTGNGFDNIGPHFVKHLPAHARRKLADLLSGFTNKKAWPWQCLGQCMVLLGKLSGGGRSFALMDFFIWFWTKIRRPLLRSGAASGRATGAVAGSSTLRATVLRKLRIELDNQSQLN